MVIISLLVREFEFSARPRKGESERQMRERLVRATAKVRFPPPSPLSLSQRGLSGADVCSSWILGGDS